MFVCNLEIHGWAPPLFGRDLSEASVCVCLRLCVLPDAEDAGGFRRRLAKMMRMKTTLPRQARLLLMRPCSAAAGLEAPSMCRAHGFGTRPSLLTAPPRRTGVRCLSASLRRVAEDHDQR